MSWECYVYLMNLLKVIVDCFELRNLLVIRPDL